jgi:hypothetical protein
VGRVVLASCDAFDNFPPGLTGKTLVFAGKLSPAMFGLFMQQMRLRALRRLPVAFGWLTKRGDAATARWVQPVLTQPEIRRDAVRVLRAAAADTRFLLTAAECLPGFDRPALVVWATGDRVMPPEHGRRLAGLLPHGRLAEIADSYTLIPLDQPDSLRSSGNLPAPPRPPPARPGQPGRTHRADRNPASGRAGCRRVTPSPGHRLACGYDDRDARAGVDRGGRDHLGYGAMELRGPPHGPTIDDQEAGRLLNAVLDGGISLIDTTNIALLYRRLCRSEHAPNDLALACPVGSPTRGQCVNDGQPSPI